MRSSTLPAHYLEKEHALDIFLGERFSIKMRDLPNSAKHSLNPLTCDERMLLVLARKATTDFWSDDLSEEEKRHFIHNTLKIKRIKGTIAALKEVLSFLDIRANIAEAWEYQGEDFHFKILINKNNKSIDSKDIVLFEKLLHEYKNTRSILDEILLSYHTINSINVTTGTMARTKSIAKQRSVYEARSEAPLTFSGGTMGRCYAFASNQNQGI